MIFAIVNSYFMRALLSHSRAFSADTFVAIVVFKINLIKLIAMKWPLILT